MLKSKHYKFDRQKREEIIKKIGTGNVIAIVEVDRNHRDGPELHYITDTGLIIVKNKNTKKLVTKLIARPQQIRRYFKNPTAEIKKIINLAYEHQKLGYNMA